MRVLQGDCRTALAAMGENSVDSVVTDPPYHLTTGKKGGSGPASVNLNTPQGRARVTTGFMGMTWDGGDVAFDPATWAECLRVLKPGGYLLAFSGTRTYHRMVCAIEDAGFEIRDQIGWVYGSGFPKSHNGAWGGTALKPAWEPIVMARKPLIGTVEANWLAYGTGALNIDGCRVATAGEQPRGTGDRDSWRGMEGRGDRQESDGNRTPGAGRWPANLIHDGSDEVLAAFPQAPGQLAPESFTAPSSKTRNTYGERGRRPGGFGNVGAEKGSPVPNGPMYQDKGSAARFFYAAKASKKDRGEGNTHPTVKPTDLMRYLCRLVTPAGGLVLDPFTGSGSTGKAAALEGFRFIGVELSSEYAAIADARIAYALVGDLL